MDKEYATTKETEGYRRLMDFNQFLHLIELGQTQTGAHTDASGYTTDGRPVNIENKVRNQTYIGDGYISGMTRETQIPYSANTIYIESHKVADMLMDWTCEGKTPLYVNYLNDDTVVVFNLSDLRHRPQKQHKRIWSRLYNAFEIADRELLSIADAFIYRKDGNNEYKLIQRP